MIAGRKSVREDDTYYERELDRIAEIKIPVFFSELDDNLKSEVITLLDDFIDSFFAEAEYIPNSKNRDEILSALCEEMSGMINQEEPEFYDIDSELKPKPQKELALDNELTDIFDKIISNFITELRDEGIEFPIHKEN